jgi:hypothetical protein
MDHKIQGVPAKSQPPLDLSDIPNKIFLKYQDKVCIDALKRTELTGFK